MPGKKKKILVEVPHRISGFFEIVDEYDGIKIEDPVKIGSRGAGFNISTLGKTVIEIQDNENFAKKDIEIFINDKKVDSAAETTFFIVNYIKQYTKKPFHVRINHSFELPVGCGYGASGTGALGTIFGLDYLLNLKFSYRENGRIAHIAEVINKTGLGTVCGQLNGGLCMLKEPGYPCVSERIRFPKNLRIIGGSFGMIHTKTILTDPFLNLRIKEAGKRALKKLSQEPNIKTFVRESLEFVRKTEILERLNLDKLKGLIDHLNKLNIIGASMNQLGRSVYAICKKQNEKEVLEIFNSYGSEIRVFNTSIFSKKPIIMNRSL
jgi:pantoate kinase